MRTYTGTFSVDRRDIAPHNDVYIATVIDFGDIINNGTARDLFVREFLSETISLGGLLVLCTKYPLPVIADDGMKVHTFVQYYTPDDLWEGIIGLYNLNKLRIDTDLEEVLTI